MQRKQVAVLKIKKVHIHPQGVDLEFDPPFGKHTFPKEELERKKLEPKEGMYFVKYDDGDTSLYFADVITTEQTVVGTFAIARPVYLHTAQVVLDGKHDRQPFLAHCSCGTEGRFRYQEAAYNWIDGHLQWQDEPPVSREPLMLEEAIVAEAAAREAAVAEATLAEVILGTPEQRETRREEESAEERERKYRLAQSAEHLKKHRH